jgi:hypothetical protein
MHGKILNHEVLINKKWNRNCSNAKKGGAAFAAPRGQRGGLDEDVPIIISYN